MKRTIFLLIAALTLLACENKSEVCYEDLRLLGEWERLDSPEDCHTIITYNQIILSPTRICNYTVVEQGKIHIQRTWHTEDQAEVYEDDCLYWFEGDVLCITHMTGPDEYVYLDEYLGTLRLKKVPDEERDTQQCINYIMQTIENATPYETTTEDWEGEWRVELWKQYGWLRHNWDADGTEYWTIVSFQNEYFPKKTVRIKAFSINQGWTTVDRYKITLNDFSNSVIKIHSQNVDTSPNGALVAEPDSRMVIVDGILYFYFHFQSEMASVWVDYYYGVGSRIKKKVSRSGPE